MLVNISVGFSSTHTFQGTHLLFQNNSLNGNNSRANPYPRKESNALSLSLLISLHYIDLFMTWSLAAVTTILQESNCKQCRIHLYYWSYIMPTITKLPFYHLRMYHKIDCFLLSLNTIHLQQFQNVQSDIYEGAGQEYDDPMDALRSLGSEIGQSKYYKKNS